MDTIRAILRHAGRRRVAKLSFDRIVGITVRWSGPAKIPAGWEQMGVAKTMVNLFDVLVCPRRRTNDSDTHSLFYPGSPRFDVRTIPTTLAPP